MSDRPPQPMIQQTETLVSVTLPPHFPRELFWGILGFVWIFALVGAVVFMAARWGPRPEDGERVMPQIIGVAFMASSLIFTLAVFESAREVIVVEATADELRYRRDGLFFKSRRRWPATSIVSVVAEPTGVLINEDPQIGLTAHFRNGDSKHLLRVGPGRDLRPAARLLSKKLGLGARS